MRRPTRAVKVWPAVAAFAALSFAAMVVFIGLSSFVDEAWEGFLALSVFLTIVGVPVAGACGGEGVTVEIPRRETRQMRKLRREAEERAYVRDLERELGL